MPRPRLPRGRRRRVELGALRVDISRAGDVTMISFGELDVVIHDSGRATLERMLHGLGSGEELSEVIDGEVRT